MWNRIARTVSAAEGLDLWENARLFGLLNMAMADGYIGTFDTKYHYNFWRPVTAIQLADTDGNPDTTADPTWEPLAPTPPVPDYDSGHSVEGGAAAQVLKRFFKDDDISFTACSLSFRSPRSSAAERQRCAARLPVSHKQRRRMGSHASIMGFIFAMLSTQALSMVARSLIVPSVIFCGPFTKIGMGKPRRCQSIESFVGRVLRAGVICHLAARGTPYILTFACNYNPKGLQFAA